MVIFLRCGERYDWAENENGKDGWNIRAESLGF